MKRKITSEIIKNEKISDGIFSMWIRTDLHSEVKPGQFVGLYPVNASTLLPRPISICESDSIQGAIRLVYRVVGKGTAEFSGMKPSDKVDVLGVLGNGYDLSIANNRKDITLMAGGIGIPPMLQLAKELSLSGHKTSIVVGYRNNETFLSEELSEYGKVFIATDDGSVGYKGNVIDALDAYKLTPDIIYACGPMPMLRGIKAYSTDHNVPAYISLEERMACGVGACLGCVCKTVNKDHHSHVNNARICTDGPVFNAAEVDI
ncbi:MAG: dihydroorotate dehydrogenase electron transfer subunit [Lachnospiraceae bacterium]|nr:dihydroorotate dehydrogenase electron transfer subunit [Lachnospiraceae bacterium]